MRVANYTFFFLKIRLNFIEPKDSVVSTVTGLLTAWTAEESLFCSRHGQPTFLRTVHTSSGFLTTSHPRNSLLGVSDGVKQAVRA
jgi:hypothetical protein